MKNYSNQSLKLLVMIVMAIAAWHTAMAQSVKPGPVTRVNTGQAAFHPQLTDNAQALLVTGQNYTGLTRIDLTTGQRQVLSTQPRAGRNAIASDVRTNDKLQIELTRQHKRVVLTPNGTEHRYLWPQLSPDGNRIAYTVSGQGTYVYDLTNQDLTFVGNMRAARWFDNSWLVAMQDSDDGFQVTASTIVMTNIDGTVQHTLTAPELKAMYPSAQAGHVAFCTDRGEVYVMTVNINQ